MTPVAVSDGARAELARSSGDTLMGLPFEVAPAAWVPWSSSSWMPLVAPLGGSSTSTSLKGFCWAKVVKPFSPTAGVVVTVMLSDEAEVFGFLLITKAVLLVTLEMTEPAGMAPAESFTASLEKKPVVLLTVTVLLPFVTAPVTVVVCGVDSVVPGSPFRPGQP